MEKTFGIPDIWFEIGKYLKFIDLIRLRQSCKDLHRTIKIYWLPPPSTHKLDKRILSFYPELMIFIHKKKGRRDRLYVRDDIAITLDLTQDKEDLWSVIEEGNRRFVEIVMNKISKDQMKMLNYFVKRNFFNISPKIRGRTKEKAEEVPKLYGISQKLAYFMGSPIRYRHSLNFIMDDIRDYIRINDLQDSYGLRIIPDEKLQKLFGIQKDTHLNYFNLQGYIMSHLS